MKYPIFLNLESKRAVVIGAGSVAARKILGLLDAKARLVVVAEHIDDALKARCKNTDIEFVEAKYSNDHLVGATIAFAATNDRKINEQIYKDCQQLEVLCNVADEPDLCDFYVPAIIKRDSLQVAVCTEGNCPAYAGHLRRKLEEVITEDHGRFLTELEKLRQEVFNLVSNEDKRRTILGTLAGDEAFEVFKKNGPKALGDWAEKIISESED
ncbi:MAG: bifunctional precorrin-2 dehydrogenase/sirohydrochlorin ferrochelatase [Planctomycetes bacterium]|nr:bifunctional precorrin-2 dehydrogenase/sirohydrochlorin ferrochelatase [Planctomycetota bacterium]MBU1517618.1 bifunctional precorrin-2 dehydrogenase/sirohydrochlorin ferrochelatase [Planctomycetota bacterium]MBU2457316.1 bifunctional precorrin-2 dehydrogenase/sirohydrochlorin ferrochelatase [Planctomycetota bacterium]